MSVTLEETLQLLNPDQFEGINIGPDSPSFLQLSWLNEVAQVRQSYDEAALWDLARSMVRGDLPEYATGAVLDEMELNNALVLLNPLAAAKFTSLEKAQAYLDSHAAHYRLDIHHDSETLQPAEDGCYYLLIAGHRRKRAIGMLQKRFGISDDRLRVATHVFEDIDFDEALGLQLRENIYEAPPVYEEARSIERYYEYANRKQGKRLSIRALANKLGMSETKVGDALAFASLPDEVQALTPQVLPYTIVRGLKPLHDLYRKRYSILKAAGDDIPEDQETYAREHILIFANQLIRNRLDNSDKKAETLIRTHINELLGTMSYQNGELFIYEVASVVDKRTRSDRMLGKTAISAIEYLLQHGRLSDDERQRLARLGGGAVGPQIESPSLFAL